MDRDVYVIDNDPIIVKIDGSNDNEYTLVPNVAYCSCDDHQYRQIPCKHLLYLAVGDRIPSDVSESVLSGIAYKTDDTLSSINDLEQRLDTLRRRYDTWNAVVDELNILDHLDQETIRAKETHVGEWEDFLDRDDEEIDEIQRKTSAHEIEDDEITEIARTAESGPHSANIDGSTEHWG